MRGLGRVTIAARVEDPAGFHWVAQLRRDRFPELAELKSNVVVAVMDQQPRFRDEILRRLQDATIAIIDITTHCREMVESLLRKFDISLPPGTDALDLARSHPATRDVASKILQHARYHAVELTAVPQVERLLRLAMEDADVPMGSSPVLFDRVALARLDHREFDTLLARFALAFGDVLRPERQVPAILKAVEDARYLVAARVAYLTLTEAMQPHRVYDYGPEVPFDLLRRAHATVNAHLQASMFATWMESGPGSIGQDDSSKVLGLQAADIAAGYACTLFERADSGTRAGASAVRCVFRRVLLNAEWI